MNTTTSQQDIPGSNFWQPSDRGNSIPDETRLQYIAEELVKALRSTQQVRDSRYNPTALSHFLPTGRWGTQLETYQTAVYDVMSRAAAIHFDGTGNMAFSDPTKQPSPDDQNLSFPDRMKYLSWLVRDYKTFADMVIQGKNLDILICCVFSVYRYAPDQVKALYPDPSDQFGDIELPDGPPNFGPWDFTTGRESTQTVYPSFKALQQSPLEDSNTTNTSELVPHASVENTVSTSSATVQQASSLDAASEIQQDSSSPMLHSSSSLPAGSSLNDFQLDESPHVEDLGQIKDDKMGIDGDGLPEVPRNNSHPVTLPVPTSLTGERENMDVDISSD